MSLLAQHILPASHFEHAPLATFAGSVDASRAVAAEIATLIRARQAEKRKVVLGLATGSTPVTVYAELIRLHREEGLSFANVTTFNLDEYYPLPPSHPQSYRHFMRMHLFDHVDLDPARTHLPSGTVPKNEVDAHCAAYEKMIADAGGIDFQLLGIGRTGHIGFNEPGSSKHSLTRLVTLDPLTRRDAAGDFGGDEQTPRHALTMGVRSILQSRRVVLMAWGQHKSEVIRRAIEEEATAQITASFLQEHPNALFVLDAAAAGALTRHRTPWLIGQLADQNLEWDEAMSRQAILWLSQKCQKPILKLTDDDYNDGGLQDLIRVHGSAYESNLAGFYQMQHTITGWPGGRDPARTKPGDAPVRPLRGKSAGAFPKRILILSPHPDDDVISMGGTLCRLVEQGHEVHIAYEVSGASAVSDEAVWRSLAFVRDSQVAAPGEAQRLASLCAGITEGEKLPSRSGAASLERSDPKTGSCFRSARLRRLRKTSAFPSSCRFMNPHRVHGSSAQNDVKVLHTLLSEIKPHLIYAAGDLDDPHGTHRLCLRILRDALKVSLEASETWAGESELWLYRGAWAEWPMNEIDLAVPLSPQEVLRRRRAIFRHETQKDQALFLGEDRREFWQRTEDRGRRLAQAYNALGLAEYEAIEAFKRYAPDVFVKSVAL